MGEGKRGYVARLWSEAREAGSLEEMAKLIAVPGVFALYNLLGAKFDWPSLSPWGTTFWTFIILVVWGFSLAAAELDRKRGARISELEEGLGAQEASPEARAVEALTTSTIGFGGKIGTVTVADVVCSAWQELTDGIYAKAVIRVFQARYRARSGMAESEPVIESGAAEIARKTLERELQRAGAMRCFDTTMKPGVRHFKLNEFGSEVVARLLEDGYPRI